jgi:ABC-type nitrate/sulfonate/bicarbonate transport system ATPase subunit
VFQNSLLPWRNILANDALIDMKAAARQTPAARQGSVGWSASKRSRRNCRGNYPAGCSSGPDLLALVHDPKIMLMDEFSARSTP